MSAITVEELFDIDLAETPLVENEPTTEAARSVTLPRTITTCALC